jgi:hypothetical protein
LLKEKDDLKIQDASFTGAIGEKADKTAPRNSTISKLQKPDPVSE